MHVDIHSYDDWRSTARKLLREGAAPRDIQWREHDRLQQYLEFSPTVQAGATPSTTETAAAPALPGHAGEIRVPKQFLELAETVACHRDAAKWDLLYRLLWRLAHGERQLLAIATDDDVFRARHMEKAVRRDAHKMKAFVRFRRVMREGEEYFVAFHRPDHKIVPYVASFFVRRFSVMKWAILTPDESIYWDGSLLEFGPGVPATDAPPQDQLEELWKTYYAATFNPARVNLSLMRREMPARHWPTLPETRIIPELLEAAPARVEQMIAHREGSAVSARDFLPAERDLPSLFAAATHCQGCDLCHRATQTVFGEGPSDARLVFIGEQPGDQEDLAGRPFVGPAGQVFDDALAQVGIDRSQVYVTNAVKHFKWTPRGTRRLHAKPSAREMAACRPWLEAEVTAIKPAMVVCLGSTAAQVVLGPSFRIMREHGRVFSTPWAPWTMATYHPSALLRVPDETTRATMQEQFLHDLRRAAHMLQTEAASSQDVA